MVIISAPLLDVRVSPPVVGGLEGPVDRRSSLETIEAPMSGQTVFSILHDVSRRWQRAGRICCGAGTERKELANCLVEGSACYVDVE